MVKNPPAKAGDLRDAGLIPELGKSPEGGHGNPLQYFCLENSMDRGAWWSTYSPWGCKELDTTEVIMRVHMCTHTNTCIVITDIFWCISATFNVYFNLPY